MDRERRLLAALVGKTGRALFGAGEFVLVELGARLERRVEIEAFGLSLIASNRVPVAWWPTPEATWPAALALTSEPFLLVANVVGLALLTDDRRVAGKYVLIDFRRCRPPSLVVVVVVVDVVG